MNTKCNSIDAVVAAVTQDTTPAEVEAATGLPAGTVRVLLRRAVARGRLRQTGYGRYAQSEEGKSPRQDAQVLQRPPGCPNDAHRLGTGGWFLVHGRPACVACWLGEDVDCWLCGAPATAVVNERPVCESCAVG